MYDKLSLFNGAHHVAPPFFYRVPQRTNLSLVSMRFSIEVSAYMRGLRGEVVNGHQCRLPMLVWEKFENTIVDK